MSDLDKKVADSIKLLKMAALTAMQKPECQVSARERERERV